MADTERARTGLIPPNDDELRRQVAMALSPPSKEELQHRRALYEETLHLRERSLPPGVTVDELLRQVRENDAS